MKTLSATLKVLTCAVFILALSSIAQAQATRTWVSGVGDDVNPCSRTAPCKTFAGAISKTAKDGEINAIDPGGFGTLTITKSITVDGNGTHASTLAALTTGFIVNITDVNDVRKTARIRNISIHGAASGVHGINILAGLKVYIESCQIFGFQSAATSRGVRISTTGSPQISITDTEIANCASGIDATSSGGTMALLIDKVRLQGMTDGLILQSGTGTTLRDSFVTKNSGVGVKLSGTAVVVIERSVLNNNGTGLQPGAGTQTDLSNTSIMGNGTGIATTGGTVQSHGNNQINLNSTPGAIPTGGAIIGQQ
jgi:Periplasmic copper-binding protein (NosD)